MAVVGPGRALRDPHIAAAEPGRQHRRQVYASGAMRRVVRNSPAERLGENLEDLSLHLEELPVRPIRLNRFSFPASQQNAFLQPLLDRQFQVLVLPGFFNILLEPDVVDGFDGILLVRVAGGEELPLASPPWG